MKHKCSCTRQIPEVSIIVKTQGQDAKIYGTNIKVLSEGIGLSLTIQKMMPMLKFLKKVQFQGQIKVKNYGTNRKVLLKKKTKKTPYI
jgi:hypothetical protein